MDCGICIIISIIGLFLTLLNHIQNWRKYVAHEVDTDRGTRYKFPKTWSNNPIEPHQSFHQLW